MWHMLSLQVHAKFPWHHTSKAQQNHRNQIWKISTCFCLKKFPLVCDWVKLTACCKWAQFQLRNWGKGEAGNSSQEWNVLPSTNAKGVLKYMKGIKIYIFILRTTLWIDQWAGEVIKSCPSISDFLQTPLLVTWEYIPTICIVSHSRVYHKAL